MLFKQMLPGTNCGACGYPGCLGLSEAIVSGDVLPGKCTVMSEDEVEDVALLMGRLMPARKKKSLPGWLVQAAPILRVTGRNMPASIHAVALR